MRRTTEVFWRTRRRRARCLMGMVWERRRRVGGMMDGESARDEVFEGESEPQFSRVPRSRSRFFNFFFHVIEL